MQCPRCKAINKDYHKYCFNCGLKLKKDDPYNINNHAIEYLNTAIPSDYVPTDNQQIDINKTLPLSRKQRRNIRNKKHSKFKPVQFILLPITICAVLALCIVLFKNLYLKPEPIWFDYSVEAIKSADKDMHKITIYTNKGNTIFINNKNYVANNGLLELELEDSDFINQNDNQMEKIEVNLPVTISRKGVEDENFVISYVIDKNITPLKILTPEKQQVTVQDDFLKIAIITHPNARLKINGQDYSDLIDEEGNFETTIPINKNQSQINIQAYLYGFLENTKTIEVTKQQTDVKLSFNSDIPYRVKNKTITITGKTEPDAQLYTPNKLYGDIYFDKNTGDFKMEVILEDIGENVIEITAQKSQDFKTTRYINIIREMSENEYTRKAWTVDYQQLSEQLSLFEDKILLYKGKVIEILDNQDNKIAFILDIGYDIQQSQPIYIEFNKNYKLEIGNIIRVFGETDGYYDPVKKIPKIIAEYIYDF